LRELENLGPTASPVQAGPLVQRVRGAFAQTKQFFATFQTNAAGPPSQLAGCRTSA
jgi:hypothetical protein